jgi:patatin-like phospholipase
MRKLAFRALPLLLAAALGGCATPRPVDREPIEPVSIQPPRPSPLPLRLADEERALLGPGKQVDWGVALSGGGLRSAYFSLGVLKALYDSKLLDEADILSTVSGGGYAGYWLYANHLAGWAPGQRFAQYSLSDEAFPKRLCELITKGNFVTYGRLHRLISRNPYPRSVALYEQSLQRTFGGADGQPAPLSLTDLKAAMGRLEAPYLIQNATIDSEGAEQSWPRKLIEFTPLFYGTEDGTADVRHIGWNSEPFSAPLPLRQTTAISGAAFPPLKQKVALRRPYRRDDPTTEMILHDGGKSENLGAIALIRRGVPNIIIADAEHDPGYVFDAYRKLQANLKRYGLTLEAPVIDHHLRPGPLRAFTDAFAVGHVRDDRTGKPVSTLYYIKASLPLSLAALMDAQRVEGSEGAAVQRGYYEALKRTADGARGQWRCGDLDSPPLPMVSWAAHNAGRYAHYLGASGKAKLVDLISDAAGVPAMKIRFPQYSTGDQSFYLDQAQAFIGLGYLEARELSSALGYVAPGWHRPGLATSPER